MAVLIKPQFEVGRERVGKGGVVRDPALHQEVCARIEGWVDAQLGWRVEGIVESPITGPEGNREFLLVARKILLPSWEKVAKASRVRSKSVAEAGRGESGSADRRCLS